MKTRLIFVRHAEAEGNAYRRFHGWTDGAITEKGHLQARSVAKRLENVPIDVLYSSSLKRTLQTCEYIAKLKNLPIIRTDNMKEINGGDWEQELWDELPDKWSNEYETWINKPHLHQMPNGESMVEFKNRLVKEIKSIIHNNIGKNICIVTHGTAIKVLMSYFYGYELEEMLNIVWYDNTAVTIVDYEEGKFNVVLAGDISHLEKDLSTFETQDWWIEYKKNRINNSDHIE